MKAYKELLFLTKIRGIGPARINKVYLEYLRNGVDIPTLKDIVIEKEKKTEKSDIESAEEFAEKTYSMMINRDDVTILTILDEDYPNKVKDLGNSAPVILYVKGDVSILNSKSIAIIGTREPSEWSKKIAPRLVAKIIENSDYTITGGLAVGCDTLGHTACIENGGKTIALLPCGFDRISPSENIGLSESIIEKGGALVSEYLPATEATSYTFVERDSLIAALSDAILVIECNIKSGTMHAVNDGAKLNRRIAAYVTALKENGNYTGNDFIISNKSGVEIKDTEDLNKFLGLISGSDKDLHINPGNVQEAIQMSLFSIIGE